MRNDDNVATEQEIDLRVQIVGNWLKERGFSDASMQLVQASEHVAQRIDEAYAVEWLYYLHESGDPLSDDDLPFLAD